MKLGHNFTYWIYIEQGQFNFNTLASTVLLTQGGKFHKIQENFHIIWP